MKYSVLILICIICFSCSQGKDSESGNLDNAEKLSSYDTVVFNMKLTPDTAGCSWIIADREILDSLVLERTIIKTTSDTFLTTSKYKRLWACSVPSFLLIPNDTILISGYVYRVYSSDGLPGYPTLVTQIVYAKNN
jgi:hypothetical protein